MIGSLMDGEERCSPRFRPLWCLFAARGLWEEEDVKNEWSRWVGVESENMMARQEEERQRDEGHGQRA